MVSICMEEFVQSVSTVSEKGVEWLNVAEEVHVSDEE